MFRFPVLDRRDCSKSTVDVLQAKPLRVEAVLFVEWLCQILAVVVEAHSEA